MELTVDNFEERLDLLLSSIRSCEFLAIDTEFSGHLTSYADKCHEFDTHEGKYQKNKRAIEQFLACQIGICTFVWSTLKRKYMARPFNIFLFPRSFLKEKYFLMNVGIFSFNNS